MSELQKIQRLVRDYLDRSEFSLTMHAKNNFERKIALAMSHANGFGGELKDDHFSALTYMLIGRAIADVDQDLLFKVSRHAGFKN